MTEYFIGVALLIAMAVLSEIIPFKSKRKN